MIHRVQQRDGALKAAVIGAGAFGRHHAAKYRAIPGVELAAVADPCPDVRRHYQIGARLPAVADWRELLGHVDLVSICSPAVTHAPIVRAFLNSGAHVLVEKPIATDVDEADGLIALAERTGKVLTVGHQERFVFAGTGLLERAEVPLEISCWRLGPWTGRGADVTVVLDLMIHDIDLVHRLVPDEIAAVAARSRAVHARNADEVTAELEFAGGTRVRLDASRVSGTRSRGMRLTYEDGQIEIDFLARKVRNSTRFALPPLKFDDPLCLAVKAFVESVRSGAATMVRPEEAREALKTALLIEDAAERIGALETETYPLYAAAG